MARANTVLELLDKHPIPFEVRRIGLSRTWKVQDVQWKTFGEDRYAVFNLTDGLSLWMIIDSRRDKAEWLAVE